MSTTIKALVTALLLCTFNLVAAKHILTGDVTRYGRFDSSKGRREYSVTAHTLLPILVWEDLQKDGVTAETCTKDSIKFTGNIDASDFAQGIVITFPMDEYVALGCPLPPVTDALSKVDKIVFRKIEASKASKDAIVVLTKYISGARVVPKVDLHVGNLLPTARQVSSIDGPHDSDVRALSRAESGEVDFTRQGSKQLFTGAKIDWRFSVSAGFSDFEFERTTLHATWNQRISADATATLDFDRRFEKTISGEIFKTAIPGAGFSFKVFLLGRVTVGLSAGIDYEAAIEGGAAATATFSGGVDARQKVIVGFTHFDVNALPTSGRNGVATLNFKDPTGSASAYVDGFVGVRPYIEAGIELPLVGDASVDVGGTVGLNANVQFNSVPFTPVTSGRTIGVCSNCHHVQGTLDLEGRHLSVSAKLPGTSKLEKVIRSKFLDYRIGTLCLFRETCPVVTPTPSPAPVASACKCTCTTLQTAMLQCAGRQALCKVSSCGGGPFQFSRCCPV